MVRRIYVSGPRYEFKWHPQSDPIPYRTSGDTM